MLHDKLVFQKWLLVTFFVIICGFSVEAERGSPNSFDDTMGSFYGTEVCEPRGLYVPKSVIKH